MNETYTPPVDVVADGKRLLERTGSKFGNPRYRELAHFHREEDCRIAALSMNNCEGLSEQELSTEFIGVCLDLMEPLCTALVTAQTLLTPSQFDSILPLTPEEKEQFLDNVMRVLPFLTARMATLDASDDCFQSEAPLGLDNRDAASWSEQERSA